MKRVAVSWSGGKDSCLAAYKASQAGYRITTLLNSISDDYHRVRFHGVEAKLIQLQAEAMGIYLIQKPTRAEFYTDDYMQLLRELSTVDGLVFGDIHLVHCLQWAQQICDRFGWTLIEPLWRKKQIDLLKEFVDTGFEAVVVSTQAQLLEKEWIGRSVDGKFIADISKLSNVDPSGENGEYHTIVVNGPLFRKKLMLKSTETVFRNGYWFLDIKDYGLV